VSVLRLEAGRARLLAMPGPARYRSNDCRGYLKCRPGAATSKKSRAKANARAVNATDSPSYAAAEVTVDLI
jgi:hypothetical protein